MAAFKLDDTVFDVSITKQKNDTFFLEAISKCGIKFNATITANEKQNIQQAFAANKVTARYPCLCHKEDCDSIILCYTFTDKTNKVHICTKQLDYETWDVMHELIEAKKEIRVLKALTSTLTTQVTQFQEKEALIAALKIMALGEKDRTAGKGISASESRAQLKAARQSRK